jgi:hypothetical protein
MNKADRELAAIGTILKAFDGLDGESIQRVLDYVFSRLSLNRPNASAPTTVVAPPTSPNVGMASASTRQPSIKDLRDEKQPESSNQMAALVAYYLAEIAPEDERRSTISSADIEKYFKQARFNLPKRQGMALPNAAAAGYLDPVGAGTYKLNPVGYNLVAHALPRDASKTDSTSRSRPRRRSKR